MYVYLVFVAVSVDVEEKSYDEDDVQLFVGMVFGSAYLYVCIIRVYACLHVCHEVDVGACEGAYECIL